MTGVRRGELLGLYWEDVDWERSRLWVRRSIGLNGSKKPKSRRSVRAVAFPKMLWDELDAHWKASSFKGDEDYVFASSTGTALDGRNMVRAVFVPALKQAGLPKIRFHDMRHTYATLLIEQKAHPKYISEQLGHASVKTTMDTYSHLFDQSYADESAKLEEALRKVREDTRPASALQAVRVENDAGRFHGDVAETQEIAATEHV